jgi:hypothetical protein
MAGPMAGISNFIKESTITVGFERMSSPGKKLGLVGNTGNTTGAHGHVERFTGRSGTAAMRSQFEISHVRPTR